MVLLASHLTQLTSFLTTPPRTHGKQALNGILAPRSFDGFVVIVKIIGTVLAVASGLAIGPEGPTIHLGAAVTLNMVWVAQSLFGKKFASLNNDHDKRLFLAAGAVSCVSPVSPVLFVFFVTELP
jgi:chloride channel 7